MVRTRLLSPPKIPKNVSDLKHLMAVMLLTRLARKAVVVVREVTSMDTRA